MDDTPRFKPLTTLPGLLFVPSGCSKKKHPCAECFDCQWCSDSRCASCRGACGKGTAGAGEPGGRGTPLP